VPLFLISALKIFFMNPLKVNEYFEGKVKSISFQGDRYNSTVGVMVPGTYEFSTGKAEIMTIMSGELVVKLPGKSEWKKFEAGNNFKVEGNSKFQLKVIRDAAYLCEFVD
jgi:purine/pyrimidine-nucleoside phosphorylase